MEEKIQFFIPCKDGWREGFFIPVRNRLNHEIEREFLPIELKDSFLNSWQENIIFEDQFEDWYAEERNREVEARKSMVDETEEFDF